MAVINVSIRWGVLVDGSIRQINVTLRNNKHLVVANVFVIGDTNVKMEDGRT